MLLSYNEYTSYRVGYFKKLKTKLLRKIKTSSFFVITATILIIITLYLSGLFTIIGNRIERTISYATVATGIKLNNIYLEGQHYIDGRLISNMIDDKIGRSMFDLDIWDLKARIEKLNWVFAASVVRELPDTIHIRIVERIPMAIWQNNKKQYLIDEHGYIIQDYNLDKFAHLPVIVGEGSRLGAAHFIHEMKEFPEFYGMVTSLIRVGNRRWNARLNIGTEIKFPETGSKQALLYLMEYNKTHKLFSGEYQSIDMRLSDKIFVKRKK